MSFRVVLRVREAAGGEGVHYKHEGERYVGKNAQAAASDAHARVTLKLAAGKRYVFSLALPSGLEIKDANEAGDKEVQILKDSDEEAEAVKVFSDEKNKANQCVEWTNTMAPCANTQRQVLRLCLVTEQELKMDLPILVKTYKETDTKGLRNGKPLMYANYKLKPNLKLAYDLVSVAVN